MGKPKLVVIGNGMAGVRCVEELLALAPGLYDITIFGSEPHPNYNRIMLSKVLQGDTNVGDITINDWQWYADNGIALHAGDPVVRIDTANKTVESQSGRMAAYDRLIIATGSLPFMLPLPGADKPGVTAFRNIQDCETMMKAAESHKRAVVIGGGLLGLEAARGLLNLGMTVQVVHIYRHLMERQLTPTAAGMLQAELERQGMTFLLEKQTERILGRKRAEGLLFKDGSRADADLVVIAVGVRPNVKLAADAGIETNRAIVVDDYMQTSVPDVFAVGECAEHRGMVYGLVAPLYEQGKVLARKLCGTDGAPYEGSILYSQLKVSGVDVFSAGEIRDAEISTSLRYYDGVRGTYKKIAVKDGKIVGAVLFGDIGESNKLLRLIKQRADVTALDAARTGGDGTYADALDRTATVCSCNGVTKGAILDAVAANGCRTIEDVRACTRASGTCGGCKPVVAALLQSALRDVAERKKETVCGCTAFGQDELREAVITGRFGSTIEAMRALGWASPEGCSACEPAVRYYVGLAQSRAFGRGDGSASRCGHPLPAVRASALTLDAGGLRDAAGLGAALERRMRGLRMPAAVGIAVSSGPRHEAGTRAAGLGIAGVPGGWELHVGGRNDTQVRQGELLCTVSTDEEAVAMALAFLQLYREEARYGERPAQWIERIGVVTVREKLFEEADRAALLSRADPEHYGAGRTGSIVSMPPAAAPIG